MGRTDCRTRPSKIILSTNLLERFDGRVRTGNVTSLIPLDDFFINRFQIILPSVFLLLYIRHLSLTSLLDKFKFDLEDLIINLSIAFRIRSRNLVLDSIKPILMIIIIFWLIFFFWGGVLWIRWNQFQNQSQNQTLVIEIDISCIDLESISGWMRKGGLKKDWRGVEEEL